MMQCRCHGVLCCDTAAQEDVDWLEVALAGDAAQDNASPWVLRLTLSHDVKNAKEISFAEIKKMVGVWLCA
jgi:hypothetical protein